MLRGDAQELVDAAQEALRILLVGEVVQEHAHRIHADVRRPSQLEIDAGRIEGIGLPHLELVDCGGGHVIGADEEALTGIPLAPLRLGPARTGDGRRNVTEQRDQ